MKTILDVRMVFLFLCKKSSEIYFKKRIVPNDNSINESIIEIRTRIFFTGSLYFFIRRMEISFDFLDPKIIFIDLNLDEKNLMFFEFLMIKRYVPDLSA